MSRALDGCATPNLDLTKAAAIHPSWPKCHERWVVTRGQHTGIKTNA
jgi:hypothetical protein